MLVEVFVSTGRVSHLVQLLAWHPKYLHVFQRVMSFVMRGDGPLPVAWRHYLAIMAASRHRCCYAVQLEACSFLANDGPLECLQDIRYAERKLRNISLLNAKLAHRPWTVTLHDVEALVKGEDAWTMGGKLVGRREALARRGAGIH